MLIKSYSIHPSFGEWAVENLFWLPRRFLVPGTLPSALISPAVADPLQALSAKTGVRLVDLIADLRVLPSSSATTARLAVFSFLAATVVSFRVASSLLRFSPGLWDWAGLFFLLAIGSKDLFRLLHIRSAVRLLARTVSLAPKQLSLLDLGQHASLYSSFAARIAATGEAKPSEADISAVQQPVSGPVPLVTLRRRAASPARGTSLRAVRKAADTLPATGMTAAAASANAFGSSFAASLRQSTANAAFAAGGGDTLDATRLDGLGLQAPTSAATNALAAAIEAAAAARQAELAAAGQGSDSSSSSSGAGGGAAGGPGAASLFDSGFGQMKGFINRLWKADGDTLLVGGSVDRTMTFPATPGGSAGPTSLDEDSLLAASTVAPVDRFREPYLASISSPSSFMRRAGDALPILHVSTLRRPLSFDLAGGPLQALDATAAAIQRVLHRHFTRVLLEAMRRNTLNLMAANKLLTPAFLTRGTEGAEGGATESVAGGIGAASSSSAVVRLPGIRSNQPMTLDELLVEMTTRMQPDSRYLPRRTLSTAALSVDTNPFASTSKPPVASDAAPALGSSGSSGLGFSFGIPGGISAQTFSSSFAAGGATASIAERLAADAKRAKQATDSVVVDLWQERADLESFLCPPVPVLAAAGVISPAVAAELNVLMSGGTAPSSSSSASGASAGGSNALSILAQVKSYCFSRLAVLLGDRNGLGHFLGNTDPISAASSQRGSEGFGFYGFGSSGSSSSATAAFSGRPSDSLLLLNYVFALMDLEMIRAARFSLRQQQMQAAAAKASGTAAPEEDAAKKPVSPAAALLQQVATMKLSDRPFSRAHLAYGPIPTPPAPSHAAGGGGGGGGGAGFASPRHYSSSANAASADPRSPLALPELSSAVSGTSTVVAAQRAKIKLHFDLSPAASASSSSTSSESTCLIGLTLPALQTLLDRSSVASLLATGSLRAVGGADAVAQGLGAGPVLDPAAILAAVTVSDIGCGDGSGSSGGGGSSSFRSGRVGGGGGGIASRTVLPRSLALFFLLLRHTYSGRESNMVGSPSRAAASTAAPLRYCEVELQWAVRELLHAFVSSSALE